MEEISQSSAPPLDSLKLSHKITEVAAGEAHTLALTADRSVYSWGTRMFGRLGTGSEFDQMFPVRVEFGSAAVKIVSIAAGAYHSIALAGRATISFLYCLFSLFDGYILILNALVFLSEKSVCTIGI